MSPTRPCDGDASLSLAQTAGLALAPARPPLEKEGQPGACPPRGNQAPRVWGLQWTVPSPPCSLAPDKWFRPCGAGPEMSNIPHDGFKVQISAMKQRGLNKLILDASVRILGIEDPFCSARGRGKVSLGLCLPTNCVQDSGRVSGFPWGEISSPALNVLSSPHSPRKTAENFLLFPLCFCRLLIVHLAPWVSRKKQRRACGLVA